ncbi:MAG: elongation factor G, partial [Pirellulales bacterium]
FRIAANAAFDRGLDQARVVLLEPIMRVQISTPEENLGDIISNLQQKRAVIHGNTHRGNRTIIDAEAPLSLLFGFESELRSLSKGLASSTMEPSTYGPVPPEVMNGFV